jgi:hypothetical protein
MPWMHLAPYQLALEATSASHAYVLLQHAVSLPPSGSSHFYQMTMKPLC